MKVKNIIVSGFALYLSFSILNTNIFADVKNDDVKPKVTTQSELFNTKYREKSKTLTELEKIRDCLVRYNYDRIYIKSVPKDNLSYNEYYKQRVFGDAGVHKYFTKKYSEMNMIEILKKEITFINFLNENSLTIFGDGSFYDSYYNVFKSNEIKSMLKISNRIDRNSNILESFEYTVLREGNKKIIIPVVIKIILQRHCNGVKI